MVDICGFEQTVRGENEAVGGQLEALWHALPRQEKH